MRLLAVARAANMAGHSARLLLDAAWPAGHAAHARFERVFSFCTPKCATVARNAKDGGASTEDASRRRRARSNGRVDVRPWVGLHANDRILSPPCPSPLPFL